MRDRWRTLARSVVVAALMACSSSRPPGLGDTTGGPDGSMGSACATPGAMGCPCSLVGETAACGDVVIKSGTYVTCSMGNSTCDGNTWGPCIGNVIVSKSLATPPPRTSGGLHFTALGTGGPCAAGSNPCDPNCNQTVDDPTTGFTAPPGFAAGPSGLTLSGSLTVPCTSLLITPSSSAVTVTSLTTPGTITLTATPFPAPCATSPFPTTWTIDDVDQSTITGTNNTNGVLTLQTPLPGTTNVTAYGAGTSGIAVITIKLNIVDITGIAPNTPATGMRWGNFYVGGVTSGAPLPGTTASTASWLYPYANTYFPLALPAPVVMYKYATAPLPQRVVKMSLRYPAGSTEATSTFNYATIVNESNPDPQVYTLQAAWQRFEQTARGNDASLVVQRWTGPNAGLGVLENETLRTIHFVDGQLKGTVFYNSYSSPQGNNTGAVLSIAPGATTPTLAVQPGGHCTVCHSLNLDGSKLIANGGGPPGADWFNQSKRWNIAGGGAPSPPVLNNYAYSNAPPGNDNDVVGDKFTFGAPRTDGSLYMTHGGSGTGDPNWRAPASVSNLYDPSNPAMAKVVIGWPNNVQAVTPKFSPDGAKLAFGFWGGNTLAKSPAGMLSSDTTGKTMTVVDFTCNAGCTAGWTISNARAVTSAASPGGKVAWPSFVPDGSAVLYQRQIVSSKAYLGWSPSDINTVAGAQADIWMSDVPATSAMAATPTRLNALNGLTAAGANYLPTSSRTVGPPTAYHSGGININFAQADNCGNTATAINVYDYQLNYLPAVNPSQAGGKTWVVFTSRRMYGNIAYDNPWDEDPDQPCNSGVPPTKKLWVAAIDSPFVPGTDPSHPAFYLPGQELAAGNSNSYWVNTPCAAVGSTCTVSDDCCGGSVGPPPPTTTCKITTAPSTRTCQLLGGACVAAGGVCNTAGSPGDCCPGLTCPGVGGLCVNPSSIVYTPQTYTREFIGTCPSGTRVVWRFFQWQSTIPANTSIAFSAQTKELVTDTYAPVGPLGIGSATMTTPGVTWGQGAQTVDAVLLGAGLVSRPYLLVTMQFTPNAGGTAAPTLKAWQQNYDCVPGE